MRISLVATLAMAVLGASMSPAQEARPDSAFLLGALIKAQDLRDGAAASLQVIDRQIQENDRLSTKAEQLMALARQQNNRQAESVARDTLANAREARKKYENARNALEATRSRARASCAAIQDRLATGLARPSASPLQGVVSEFSGRVDVVRKNGEKSALDAGNPGFLERGDEITTYGASSAEVQTLDGRGTVRLSESSRITLEEDTPELQGLRLVQGKIYSAVEKMDDYEKTLWEKIKRFGSDVGTVGGVSREEYDAVIRGLRARLLKKFEVRTASGCGAVRGTKFSVELTNVGTTEIAVFEGAVEASALTGGKPVLVGEGFKAIVTTAGVSEPQKFTALDKWWER